MLLLAQGEYFPESDAADRAHQVDDIFFNHTYMFNTTVDGGINIR